MPVSSLMSSWCQKLQLGVRGCNCQPFSAAQNNLGAPKGFAMDTGLKVESQRSVAIIFFRLLFDVSSREVSRFQFVLGDATFALGFYALACLNELCVGPLSRLITGRLLVRTLTEIRINLAFLVENGDEAMWARFRAYGSGQAKLALLKYEDAQQGQPNLVSAETLKALANEDFFQEFVNIDLGSWSGTDLRKMAEQCGVKDDYDRFYGWTSAFVHGQWAAARDAVMATCGNPLHRAHRGPMPLQRPMESCIPDAISLVNSILASIDEC